jgi:heat shock protein HslJ
MRKTLALTAVLLAASLSACGGGEGSQESPPTDSKAGKDEAGQAVVTKSALDSRTFAAVDGKGIDGKSLEITEEDPLKIEFDGDRLSVDAGCNTVNGNYSLEGDEIQSFLVSTLMGCPPAQAELEVFTTELLRQGAVVRLDGDELSLDGKNGTSLTLTG